MDQCELRQQVAVSAGTQRALATLFRCKRCGLTPQDDVMWFLMRKWSLRERTKPAPGAVVHTAVLFVSMEPALGRRDVHGLLDRISAAGKP